MKILKTSLLFIAFATSLIACKKDDPNPGSSTPGTGSNLLVGKWVGKFGFENEEPDTYYSFTLKADGTMEERNSSNEKIGEGTWTLTGTMFIAKHHYNTGTGTQFTDIATYNAQAQKLENGTWGYTPDMSNGGKWFMQKQ